MGSAVDTAEWTADYLNARGAKVGAQGPFGSSVLGHDFVAAIPAWLKIAVLDRTKEPGSPVSRCIRMS